MKTMSATDLLDVNVWIALSDENHEHHPVAKAYWETQSAAQLAFCRVTMLGFLRLVTHRRVMNDQPLTPPEAWSAYRAFLALPEVIFLPEPSDIEPLFSSRSDALTFPNHRWTDAYLAALAQASGARLVSFDSDFHQFEKLHFLHIH